MGFRDAKAYPIISRYGTFPHIDMVEPWSTSGVGAEGGSNPGSYMGFYRGNIGIMQKKDYRIKRGP